MTNIPTEISNFFLAMQAGSLGGNAMERALAADAVYEEPFSGKTATHRGHDACDACRLGPAPSRLAPLD
jgi:hypothetical protein